jgi:hypothetical protein
VAAREEELVKLQPEVDLEVALGIQGRETEIVEDMEAEMAGPGSQLDLVRAIGLV